MLLPTQLENKLSKEINCYLRWFLKEVSANVKLHETKTSVTYE